MKRTLLVGQLIEILQSFPQDAEVLIPQDSSFTKTYAKKVYYSEEYENVVIE